MTPAARCRLLALAIGALVLGPLAAPAAAQAPTDSPLCEPPPLRLALRISPRAPVARRPVSRPKARPTAVRPATVVKAAPAKVRKPAPRRRAAKRPASVVPLPTAVMAAGSTPGSCRAWSPAAARLSMITHPDASASGELAMVAEVPLVLPDTIAQDDSTGVPLLWWLGAVAVGGAVAGGTDGGSAAMPAGLTSPGAPVAVNPVTPAWGEGDPDERPSGTPPVVTGGGGGGGGGPGTDPGDPPPPSFPPPTIVGSTPPFPFPPGGPPGGGPPGGLPPGGGDPPPGGRPPTELQPPTVTTASVVPEPAPLGLLLVGGGVLALFAWGHARRS